ncbi:putative purine-uracil permease NCS1 [Iris pallida]|uniref:Purine-uracil permease NCS1 n=1 Tax=Iris pallida TaxID=29817 RepID=A0AAX6H5D3_IRIPA|nr:putative purine-uracil permease NCS1 [Iris pallida]
MTNSAATAAEEYLRPIPSSGRTTSGWDMASLWIGVVVNVPGYYLAGSLVDLGMSWWEGILTILLANSLLLLPLLLASHPGPRYGLSFPVLLRSAFGTRGALVPALLRAFVACGWCAIESWIGGQAISLLLFRRSSTTTSWTLQFSCFLLFLLLQLAIIYRGMPAIRALQKYCAPVLVALLALLFAWSYSKAGGLGEMLSTPSRLTPLTFWPVFLPSLTACIGSWSPLALSISDFTRYCRTQRDQALGQLGLPLFAALFAFFSLAITSSTQVVFGRVVPSPVDLLAEIGGPLATALGSLGITLAVVTTNVPANLVAPANVFVSLSPSRLSFPLGCAVTTAVGVAFQPWNLIGSSESFVYTWLVGYSAIVGPIIGILLTDYYVLRRTVLDVDDLYSASPLGAYYYWHGYNVVALGVLLLCVVPAVPGFLVKVGVVAGAPEAFLAIYDNSWLFGMFSSGFLYWIVSAGLGRWRTRVDAAAKFDDPLLHVVDFLFHVMYLKKESKCGN